jgi:hypothetical protein
VDDDGEEHSTMITRRGEGEDAAANSKWSRNGFGPPSPNRAGKFSRRKSEEACTAVEGTKPPSKLADTTLFRE